MNSRFKFRVWYNKKFHYDCYIKDGKVYQLDEADGGSFSTEKLCSIGYRFTIQQFTGVKDLYNKEIYEGDIVQLEFANQPCGFGRYEIFFDRGAFQLKELEHNWVHTGFDTHLSAYNICCVIGNIFENLELAK